MPYASKAQQGYLHARKPEVAAKFDADIRRRKRIHKSADIGRLVKVRNAVAGNVPTAQDVRDKKAKLTGRIRKMAIEVPNDPHFNAQAAQRAFNLVMKMDDDTAEMFCHIVVSDLFESTVSKNLPVLQAHLDEVLKAQLDDVRTAQRRLVAKGYDQDLAVAYAQALDAVEGQIAKDWDPELHPRGHAGMFRTVITHHQKQPLRPKMEKEVLGLNSPKKTDDGSPISDADRAAFQDEYRQLGQFLRTVHQSGDAGAKSVLLHYQNVHTDENYTQPHQGTTPPMKDLLDPNTRLVAAEARPDTLTAGGAVFGLATALGGNMSPGQVKGINAIETREGKAFTDRWLKTGDPHNSNERLYNQLAASGQLMSAVAPGTKIALAGKFASIVGSAGPEAEAVLGPTARKTAYRYRGTEKSPDRALVMSYGRAIGEGKARPKYTRAEQEEATLAASTAIEPRRQPKPPEAGPVGTAGQRALDRADRPPTWAEQETGREAVAEYLRLKMPSKKLYALQLASGNTPPSEGVIINANGQIVSQAVGYADDHYLPFNLKNLKGLKGGEYIRTRSVGGLTAEDVYTGLITGARRVTVTSRSGTYTMEFKPDFRGGRRHNDKAARMTRRYEQLLDAVQSKQVERADVDPDIRAQIESEVRSEMSSSAYRPNEIHQVITQRINAYKESPYITDVDEARAEKQIEENTVGMSERERLRYRAQVYDDMNEDKEVRFKLNSAGYKGALDALAEQFPYYIYQPEWKPPRDKQLIDTEEDRGYVEPGRNRPTAAAAGLFMAGYKPQFARAGGKFSAAEADYQTGRGARATPLAAPVPVVATPGTTPAAVPGAPVDLDARDETVAVTQNVYQVNELAKQIQDAAKAALDDEAKNKDNYGPELAMTEADLNDPSKRDKFNTFAAWFLSEPGVRNYHGTDKIDKLQREWEHAIGFRERKPYDKANAAMWPPHPPAFKGKAYLPGAPDDKVNAELDKQTAIGVVNPIPLAHMSDKELLGEHNALRAMRSRLVASPGIALTMDDVKSVDVGADPASPGLSGLMSDPDAIAARLEKVQRTRAVLFHLSPQQRAAIAAGSPAVTPVSSNNTPPPSSASTANAALGMAANMDVAVMALKDRGEDPALIKRIEDLRDTLRHNEGTLRTNQDLDLHKITNKQLWDAWADAQTILVVPRTKTT